MTLHKAENVNVQNKVVLTQNEHDAIELLRAKGCTNIEIVSAQIENCLLQVNGYEHVNAMDSDRLIRALYFGYTIEQTVEEQLLELYEEAYNHAKTSHETQDWWSGRMDGIFTSLNIIGMKVKGINA